MPKRLSTSTVADSGSGKGKQRRLSPPNPSSDTAQPRANAPDVTPVSSFFAIHHLRRAVLAQLDKGDLARCIRVGKAWKRDVVAVLYEEVDFEVIEDLYKTRKSGHHRKYREAVRTVRLSINFGSPAFQREATRLDENDSLVELVPSHTRACLLLAIERVKATCANATTVTFVSQALQIDLHRTAAPHMYSSRLYAKAHGQLDPLGGSAPWSTTAGFTQSQTTCDVVVDDPADLTDDNLRLLRLPVRIIRSSGGMSAYNALCAMPKRLQDVKGDNAGDLASVHFFYKSSLTGAGLGAFVASFASNSLKTLILSAVGPHTSPIVKMNDLPDLIGLLSRNLPSLKQLDMTICSAYFWLTTAKDWRIADRSLQLEQLELSITGDKPDTFEQCLAWLYHISKLVARQHTAKIELPKRSRSGMVYNRRKSTPAPKPVRPDCAEIIKAFRSLRAATGLSIDTKSMSFHDLGVIDNSDVKLLIFDPAGQLMGPLFTLGEHALKDPKLVALAEQGFDILDEVSICRSTGGTHFEPLNEQFQGIPSLNNLIKYLKKTLWRPIESGTESY